MSRSSKSYYSIFHSSLDGIYSSFWIGKFNNLLTKEGKLSLVENQISAIHFYSKTQRIAPASLILENLLKVKPIFSLSSSVVHGKEQQTPALLNQHKQLQLATRWISSIVTERKEQKLSHRLYNELSSIAIDKRHPLIQRRDKIFKLVMKSRSTFRYSK